MGTSGRGVGRPVVLTPSADPGPVRSVTVVLHGDQDDDALLETAFDQARRSECGVLAVEFWQPSPDEDIRYAETAEQKILDGYLAGWQERFPDVGVAAELRVGDLPHVVAECASGADLLVLAASDAVRLTGRSHVAVQPGVVGSM